MYTLKVDNIPFEAEESDLEREFDYFGPVDDVYIPRDWRRFAGRRSRGFAFVRYRYRADAEDAVNDCGHKSMWLQGRRLNVYIAQEPRYGYPSSTIRRTRRRRSRTRSRTHSTSSSRSPSRNPRRRSHSRSRSPSSRANSPLSRHSVRCPSLTRRSTRSPSSPSQSPTARSIESDNRGRRYGWNRSPSVFRGRRDRYRRRKGSSRSSSESSGPTEKRRRGHSSENDSSSRKRQGRRSSSSNGEISSRAPSPDQEERAEVEKASVIEDGNAIDETLPSSQEAVEEHEEEKEALNSDFGSPDNNQQAVENNGQRWANSFHSIQLVEPV